MSFTANAAEAEELIRLSQSKGVFLAEAIWTRYMPFSRTIAEIAASGAIGTPHILSAHLGYPVGTVERILRPELGGGALLDLGVYTLNFASMCFGADIARIDSACTLSETGVDLQESITLRFADGKARVVCGCYVNSTCYFLNIARNGNYSSPAIAEGQKVEIHATGYDAAGNETGTVTMTFAEKDKMITDWTAWDLSSLGEVVEVKFDMTGDVENEYGENKSS